MALIIRRNKPKLKIVMGMVIRINSGFRVEFSKAKTMAIPMAEVKLSILTPGSNHPATKTANDEMIRRVMRLLFCFICGNLVALEKIKDESTFFLPYLFSVSTYILCM